MKRAPFLAHFHDARDGTRYRGGQCIAKTATHATIKFDAEPSLQMTEVVALEMKPTIRKGDPVVVELASSGHAIAALHDGQFAGAGPLNQEQSVDNGGYHPSRMVDNLRVLLPQLQVALNALNVTSQIVAVTTERDRGAEANLRRQSTCRRSRRSSTSWSSYWRPAVASCSERRTTRTGSGGLPSGCTYSSHPAATPTIGHYTRAELSARYQERGSTVEPVRYILKGELILAFRKPGPAPGAH